MDVSTVLTVVVINMVKNQGKVHCTKYVYVVVVYHLTIVAIGHGLLKKFWPMVIVCVVRTA